MKLNLQGLLEKIAFGTCFWSSSVRYLGNAHLGRAFEGPIFITRKKKKKTIQFKRMNLKLETEESI